MWPCCAVLSCPELCCHAVVWCGVVRCGAVRCGTVWCGVVHRLSVCWRVKAGSTPLRCITAVCCTSRWLGRSMAECSVAVSANEMRGCGWTSCLRPYCSLAWEQAGGGGGQPLAGSIAIGVARYRWM